MRSFAPLVVFVLVLSVLGCSGAREKESGSPGYVARLSEHLTLGDAHVVGNLTVWPVYTDDPIDVGEFLTLAEAIEKGVAEIREVGGGGGGNRQTAQIQIIQNDIVVERAQAGVAEPQANEPPAQVARTEDANDAVRQQDGQVIVETNFGSGASVGTLVIDNKGDLPILVCAGTLVKGGNQDRQIGEDFVIPSAQAVPVEAFCVEASRWTANRMGDATDGKFVVASLNALTPIRAKGQYEKNQGGVWSEVAKVKMQTVKQVAVVQDMDAGLNIAETANARAANDSSSLAVMLDANEEIAKKEIDPIRESVRAHFAALGGGKNAPVGFAYAVDGEPVSVRTFAHARVFSGQFEVFVNTMANEAWLAGKSREEGAEAPPPGKADDVVALVREINEADEETKAAFGNNLSGVRRADMGFNGNFYLIEEDGKKRIALTNDWTKK